MADSDNSRTLSAVTMEDFPSLGSTAPLPTYQELSATMTPTLGPFDDDPVLAVWHQWRIAWQRLDESQLRQQRLETSLLSVASAIRDASRSAPTAASRAYDEALEAEDRASIAEDRAAEDLWNTPAQSVAGATAKLQAVVTRSQPSPTSQEDPWPQIRSVIADLLKINSASAGRPAHSAVVVPASGDVSGRLNSDVPSARVIPGPPSV